MTTVVLPNTSKSKLDANLFSDVYENDNAIKKVVNGELDNENLKASAGIVDTKLASPNNSAYRVLLGVAQYFDKGQAAATYPLFGATEPSGLSGSALASGGNFIGRATEPRLFYFDDADYTVGGKTQKLRIKAVAGVNATKAAIKFTIGLYPVTFLGGTAELKIALGTVVSGSTVEINEPAASTATPGTGSDFTVPSDGAYALGCVTSGSLTSNSAVLLSAQLQTRSV